MEQLDLVIERLIKGAQAFRTMLPKVLENPRAYPREAMLLAAMVALVVLLLVLIGFLVADMVKEWRERRKLRVRVRYIKRVQVTGFIIGVVGLILLAASVAPMTVPGVKACERCHQIEQSVATWRAGSHATVACYACHSNGGVTGAIEASIRGAGRYLFKSHPRRVTIDNGVCLGCHDTVDETFVSDGIRVRHAEMIEVGMDCLLCHRGTGHAEPVRDEFVRAPQGTRIVRSTMSRCLGCHDGETASADCMTCHEEGPLDPSKTQVVEGRTISYTTCKGCHSEAVEKKCVDCHGLEMPHPVDFRRKHAGMSFRNPPLCARCHERANGRTGCSCHDDVIEMHGTYDEWFPQHGRVAMSVGRMGCNCHDGRDCAKCHDNQPFGPDY